MWKDTVKHAFTLTKEAASLWSASNAFAYAAALAFYTLFSLAPVVLITVTVAGMIFGAEAAEGRLFAQLQEAVGPEAARAVQDAVAHSRIEEAGLMPTVTGVVAMLVGATTVFAQMQIAFNEVWSVAPRPSRSTLLITLIHRVLSLAVVLSIGFVLLVSLLLSVILQAVMAYADAWLPIPGVLAGGLDTVVSLLVITALFGLLFRILPDVVLSWRDVLPAAVLTAILFVIGQTAFASYLSIAAPASPYGAAGSLVLLLLWVYYSALILLYGTAFTRVRLEAQGRQVEPNRLAVHVRKETVT